LAQIAENAFEAVLVFLIYGRGWAYTLIVGLALALVLKRPAVWMMSVFAASYAWLATYTIFHIGPIVNANAVGQIISIQGLFGALVMLTLMLLISVMAKIFLIRQSLRTLETHS
jgi:hypothetical protein